MMREEFGSSPDGAAWCLKALHPSDPLVELKGVPDINCVPSTLVNYQSTFRIANTEATDTWNFSAQFHPNPVNFGFSVNVHDDGTLAGFRALPNAQLEGSTLLAKAGSWKAISDRWRLAYFGVTVHCDAPALSNQGTLVVCQKPYEPRERTVSAKNVDNVYVTFPPLVFPDGNYPVGPVGTDFPNYAAAIAYPNSYMGQARDGCYIPLKLTRTFQDWHSDADMVAWSTSTSVSGSAGDNQAILIPNTSALLSYPHPDLPVTYFNSAGTALTCVPFPRNGSDIVADLCGKNLASSTGFVIEVRAGFEIQALPGTMFSPLLKTPVGYDLKAIEAYALVSRELKDAYPADYNDLGKLWDVIKRVSGYLAPMLSMVPKVGVFLGPAAAALGAQSSSAQIERAQEDVRRKLSTPQGRNPFLSLKKYKKPSKQGSASAQRKKK